MSTFEARRPYDPHMSLYRTPVKLSDKRSRHPVSKVCTIDGVLMEYAFLLELSVSDFPSSAVPGDGPGSYVGIHEAAGTLAHSSSVDIVDVILGEAEQLG